MKRIWTVVLFVHLYLYSSDNFIQKILQKNFQIESSFIGSHSFITFLTTENNKKFIVKQKIKSGSIDWSALWMKFSASIASTVSNLFSHKVYIIPKEQNFLGKIYNNKIAILLTRVPGVPVRKINKDWKISIIQRKTIKKQKIFTGVTKTIIESMSKHDDLAKIVALDTFIGYTDRHKGNFFYDENTDRFWVIDMDSSRKNLCKITCENFQNMLQDSNIVFSKKEIQSLIIFRDTLEELVNKNNINSIISQINSIAEEVGVQNNKIFYKLIARPKLETYIFMIEQSYIDAKKLLVITDQLIYKKTTQLINK